MYAIRSYYAERTAAEAWRGAYVYVPIEEAVPLSEGEYFHHQIAGLLAALMSSLSAMFNSTSTLFTIDIYQKWRPGADEREAVRVGRMVTAAMVVLGLLWIPFIGLLSDERMYVYLQSVQGYVSPPIAAVFLFGLFWPRANAKGAIV